MASSEAQIKEKRNISDKKYTYTFRSSVVHIHLIRGGGCMLGKGEWAVRRGAPKIFLPKIFSPKIFLPKIFLEKIFSKKIILPKIFPQTIFF